MNCQHCGVQNADHAKFCTSCGEKLSAEIAKAIPLESESTVCPMCQEEIAKSAKFCRKCGFNFSVATNAIQNEIKPDPAQRKPNLLVPELVAAETVTPPQSALLLKGMPIETPVVPGDLKFDEPLSQWHDVPTSTLDNKTSLLIMSVVFLVVLVSGAAWWMSQPNKDVVAKVTSVPAKKTANQPVPVKLKNLPSVPASTSIQEPVAKKAMAPALTPVSTTAPTATVTKRDSEVRQDAITMIQAAQRSREDDAQRKEDLKNKRKTEDGARRKFIEAENKRDSEVRMKQEHARAKVAKKVQTAASVEKRTPQQLCADRSNFFSRGICEARECEKPEQAGATFCKEMKQRQQVQSLQQAGGL